MMKLNYLSIINLNFSLKNTTKKGVKYEIFNFKNKNGKEI